MRGAGSSFPEQSADYKSDVRRPFTKPPHEVGEPFTPEWDVYADAVSPVSEIRLQIAADAVQHLELVARRRDASRCGVLAGRGNHVGIMRRNGRVIALIQEQLHHRDERGVDIRLSLKGHVFGSR
jgi:hypothetical protein